MIKYHKNAKKLYKFDGNIEPEVVVMMKGIIEWMKRCNEFLGVSLRMMYVRVYNLHVFEGMKAQLLIKDVLARERI